MARFRLVLRSNRNVNSPYVHLANEVPIHKASLRVQIERILLAGFPGVDIAPIEPAHEIHDGCSAFVFVVEAKSKKDVERLARSITYIDPVNEPYRIVGFDIYPIQERKDVVQGAKNG